MRSCSFIRTVGTVLVLGTILSAQTVVRQSGAERAFERGRQSLIGKDKNLEQAKELLLEAVKDEGRDFKSNSLCYAYVYLGYVEDLGKNREAAISWFSKALQIEQADAGILEVAKAGLSRPVTWIRHLDADQPQPGATPPSVRSMQIGAGYVANFPPANVVPAATLSPKQQRENFNVLWEGLDKTYAGFDLKHIDWKSVRERYIKRLAEVKDTDGFYLLLFQLVNELKDSHSFLHNYRPRIDFVGPGVMIDLFDGKPFVTSVVGDSAAGVKVGAEIVEVDGLTVDQQFERLRPYISACSSERAYRSQARHYLLAGDRGTTATVKLRLPEGKIERVGLKRDTALQRRWPARTPRLELTRQKFVHFGRDASGVGYIWITSFNGREEIADEFDRALEALKDAPGLVIDVRDNQGGFGNAQARIIGRFSLGRAHALISHVKNGPGHKDLGTRQGYVGPVGNWQYKRPVALLINEGTGSATDLFVVQFRYGAPVVTVGSATHGNLSGTAQFVVLPCGLAVRVSNAYISDPLDKSIEVNGNPPDIPVQPTIGDFLEKRDPVLERAIEVVLKDKARFDRVREALLSRIAAAKSSPDGFFQSGSAALSGMRYDEAERAFRKGIELWPGDRQNLQGLVEVYMQQTRTSEAFQVLREALAKDPGRTELWEALGDASVRAGQYEAAKEHYTKALDGTERQPNTAANLHLRIGDIYRRNGDLKQARAELQKAAELVPEDKTIASTLALVSNVMRRTSEAETAYEGNNLFRSMHLHNEAYRMATRGIDLDTALAYALNARQLLPESGEVADTLAFVYLRKGQPALALPLAQEAVRKSPDSATFQHRLGAALAGTGERPGAVTALEAALRSSPPKEVELQIRKLLAELGK